MLKTNGAPNSAFSQIIRFSTTYTLWLLIVLALFVRLYKINNPVSDWHAFRQADTASVTREYLKNGINLLQPRYQDLSNIQSGKDNLEGYRMVEFPFNNVLTAVLVYVLPGTQLVLVSRLVSVGWSLIALGALYQLVKKISGKRVAAVTGFVFAVLPYSVFYSRAILPEPAAVALLIVSLLGFYTWVKEQSRLWWLISALSLASAMLLKPFVAFFAPVFLAFMILYWPKMAWFNPKNWLALFAMGAISLLPFWWWRTWITQFPSGIPASDWLFNGNGIRLRPAWWRWLFWERITKLILGYIGLLISLFNLTNWAKDIWVYAAWWLGAFSYMVIIASGNVQHDYYQVILLPIICISVGRGVVVLYDWLQKKLPQNWSQGIVSLLLAGLFFLSWQQVKGYFNVNHWEYVRAGAIVDTIVPADAQVIAPAFGDTQFLFQTNRTGWPIGFEIDKKIELGADYYVTTALDDEARELMEKYTVIFQDPEFIIIDLQQPKEQ